MLYLSTYLGRPVLDAANRRVGTIHDLVARLGGSYPPVSALRVRTRPRRHIDVDWREVRSFETTQVILARPIDDVVAYEIHERDVLLARNVLDKQIVDLEGRRLIRVQDIQLSRAGDRLRVLGVDVSTSALLRRLRLRRVADRIASTHPPNAVAWADVDLGSWRDPNIRLRVSRAGLRRLHPADLAEIAADLPTSEAVGLVDTLEDEVAADMLEEMSPEAQIRLLDALGPERAAQLLEDMSPDDAADLIQDLSQEAANELLSRMEPAEAAEVRELLRYEETSAGGLMTSEVFTVSPSATTTEVIEQLRERLPDKEQAYHMYVVDDGGHLVGELSLWSLVSSPPQATIASIMHRDPVSVHVDAGKDEVVEAIMKYNLLGVPVVDSGEHLVGVITFDDAIDLVGPQSGRLDPRRFLR